MALPELKLLRSMPSPWRQSLRRRLHLRYNSSKPRPQNAEEPDFVSIVDAPPKLISTRKKNSKLGIAVLAVIPLTAFVLGSWQVQRLDWKTRLIAKFEDRLVRPPLPLPPRIDPEAINEFD